MAFYAERLTMINDDFEEVETIDGESLTDLILTLRQRQVEAMIYLARHQDLRAGVRLYTPVPGDEKFPPVKRAAFIEFPEKSMEWGFTEAAYNTWLDSLPQYDL